MIFEYNILIWITIDSWSVVVVYKHYTTLITLIETLPVMLNAVSS